MSLEELRAALADRRVNVVADATGLSRKTVARIRDGKVLNPSYEAVQKLITYIQG